MFVSSLSQNTVLLIQKHIFATERRFFCWDIILQKIFFNTNNLLKISRAFGTHPDSFISDDVCCYSQPGFSYLSNTDLTTLVFRTIRSSSRYWSKPPTTCQTEKHQVWLKTLHNLQKNTQNKLVWILIYNCWKMLNAAEIKKGHNLCVQGIKSSSRKLDKWLVRHMQELWPLVPGEFHCLVVRHWIITNNTLLRFNGIRNS